MALSSSSYSIRNIAESAKVINVKVQLRRRPSINVLALPICDGASTAAASDIIQNSSINYNTVSQSHINLQ